MRSKSFLIVLVICLTFLFSLWEEGTRLERVHLQIGGVIYDATLSQ